MSSDPVIAQFVSETLPALRRDWQAKHVIVFGSRAKGEADRWSDLDVIVVSDGFNGRRFVDRAGDLLEAVDSPLELEPLCYTPEEFERKRREPGIVATACEEGIWLT